MPPDAECAQCRDLSRLVVLQDELLACYRIGRRPSGKLLDGLHAVRARIAARIDKAASALPPGGPRVP